MEAKSQAQDNHDIQSYNSEHLKSRISSRYAGFSCNPQALMPAHHSSASVGKPPKYYIDRDVRICMEWECLIQPYVPPFCLHLRGDLSHLNFLIRNPITDAPRPPVATSHVIIANPESTTYPLLHRALHTFPAQYCDLQAMQRG